MKKFTIILLGIASSTVQAIRIDHVSNKSGQDAFIIAYTPKEIYRITAGGPLLSEKDLESLMIARVLHIPGLSGVVSAHVISSYPVIEPNTSGPLDVPSSVTNLFISTKMGLFKLESNFQRSMFAVFKQLSVDAQGNVQIDGKNLSKVS